MLWLDCEDYNCLSCLGLRCLSVKFDRKGAPYSVCRNCGTRSFYRSRAAFFGLAVLSDVVEEMAKAAAEDPSVVRQFEAKREAFAERLRSRQGVHSGTRPEAADRAPARTPAEELSA